VSGVPLLVPADEHHGVLAAVRAWRAAGYAPWVAVWERGWYVARSRAAAGVIEVVDPAADADRFVRDVGAAAARVDAAAVLPSAEVSFLALAGRGSELPPGVALGVPRRELVLRATDKAELNRLAEAAGLSTPPTREAARDELASAAGEVGFPLLLKPVRSRLATAGGTVLEGSAQQVARPGELDAAAAEVPGERVLLQRRLDGELYAVSGLAWQGELLCAIHQTSRRIWPPGAGGSASAVSVPPDPALDARLAELIGALEWSGIYQAQFIRRPEGAYLIDFNPRIYGTIGVAIRAGVNLPALWAALVLGGRPAIPSYRAGVGFRAGEKDIRAIPALAARGRWREAATALAPRRGTARAVLAWRDPAPVLTSVAKVLRRIL
jgi:predicted ATP-grasp superfamily ATP-dependent carboligase